MYLMLPFTKKSPFFEGQIGISPFEENGKPLFVYEENLRETWNFEVISKLLNPKIEI